MPKKPISLGRLKDSNKTYHNLVVNRLERGRKLEIALRNRRKHIERLEQMPFFRSLLRSRQSFFLNVGGEKKRYTLLMNAMKGTRIRKATYVEQWSERDSKHRRYEKNEGVKRNLVFLLDPLGRVRVFSRETEQGKKYWKELRGFSENRKGEIECKERAIFTKEREELEEINKLIRQHEKDMDFHNWPARRLLDIIQYL
jgi:hypothetical protein